MKTNPISIRAALIPVLLLIALLSYNVLVFGDDALSGSNQFILLIGGAIAAAVGFAHKISYKTMLHKVSENIQSVAGAILILLFVGALAGTWLISGIIPAMIYYGLQIIDPSFFLPVFFAGRFFLATFFLAAGFFFFGLFFAAGFFLATFFLAAGFFLAQMIIGGGFWLERL